MDYNRLFSGPKDGNFVAFVEELQRNSINAIKKHSETAMLEKSEQLSKSNIKAHRETQPKSESRNYKREDSSFSQSRSQKSAVNNASAQSYKKGTARAAPKNTQTSKAQDIAFNNTKVSHKDSGTIVLSILFTLSVAVAIFAQEPFFLFFSAIFGLGVHQAMKRNKIKARQGIK